MEPHRNSTNREATSVPTVYTVGHGDRSVAELIALLRTHSITGIADIRAYPASRRHPQFNRSALAAALDKVDVAYCWLGESLGGYRRGAATSVHTALTEASLRAYADHMQTDAFQAGITTLLAHAAQCTVAMLCAERRPEQCHRALVADYLTAQAVPVVHVLTAGQQCPHRLSPLARHDGGQLIYDRGDVQLNWEF